MLRFASLLLLALAASGSALAQTCTTSWTDVGGGAWTDGSKWDNGVPSAGSVACITLEGTYTVTVNGFSVDVLRLGAAAGTQTLVNSGGITLGSSALVTANGVVEWTAEYLNAGTLVNEGLIRLTGSTGSRGVRGVDAVLVNGGAVEHSSTGAFYIYSGGRVENASDWAVTDAGDYLGSSGVGTFVNEAGATLTKSGAGLSIVNGGGLVFDNAGTLDVQGGAFRFDRPSTHTGATLTTASEATLQFNAGGATFVGTTSGAQAGTLLLNNGFAAGAGAEWAFTGTGIEWTAEYLEAGTLTNTGLIRLAGGTGSRGVRGADAVLVNEGTVEHSSTGAFYIYAGSVVRNTSDWAITDEGDYLGSSGVGTFVNEAGATLTKSGAGLSIVNGGGLVFDNAGTLDVQGGAFRFDRPSTHTGATLTTASEATLQFNAGGATFVGTTSGAQAGTLLLDDGFAAGSGAEWAFTGTGIEWTADYLEAGTLTNTGVVRLTGGTGSRGVRNAGAVLRNTGTVEHADTGTFYIYAGGRVENASDWAVTNDGDYLGSTGAGTFVNEASGTVTKSGAGLSIVNGGGLVFDNAGTLDVQGGAFRFDRPSTHTGATLTTASEATLQFNAGGATFVGTTSGAQAGTLLLNNGFAAGAGAEWAFTGTGIEWTADYLEAGTLTNTGVVRLTGGTGSRGVRNAGAVLRNTGTVEHADTGTFYIYAGGRVENASDWAVTNDGDYLGSTGAGTFVNETSGTVTKSGAGLSIVNGGGLVFDNAGTLDVQGGAFRFDRPSTHTGATLTTADGATLQFNAGGATFGGTTSGVQAGTLLLDDGFAAGAGAEWAFTGTGIEWTADYLEAGTLTNTGLIRLTGVTGSRGVRGAGTRFRNESTVAWTGTGVFYIYSEGRVENAGTWAVSEGGDLYGYTGPGTFLNEADGVFLASGAEETQVVGGALTFENRGLVDVEGTLRVQRPFLHFADALLQGTGTFAPGTQFVHQGDIAPGTSPGRLDWSGLFAPDSVATLRIEIGGTTAGTDYDQLRVTGTVQANGRLAVDLLGSFAPTDGDVLTVLTATEVSSLTAAAVSGGFEFVGLVDPVADISLYPDVTETAVTLTAFNGIPTVSGTLAIAPEEAVNNQAVEFTVTGTGFAPDLSIFLACTDCVDPTVGPVPGLIRRIRPTEIVVLFDLEPEVSGLYDVVVTDPRGGEARGSLTITEAPPVLSIAVLDGQASERARRPGLFVIRSNRPVREALAVPISLSGSAVNYLDYMTDVIRNTVTFPIGRDSVVVGVYPLNDSVTESTESVGMQILYEGETGPTFASLSITDGPPEDAFEVYIATPDRAANLGLFTMTVGGQGFTGATTVRLANGPLEPVSTEVNPAGTILAATFDLSSQPFGLRDVIVESGDGESRTLSGAVTIEGPTYPEVSASVLAPPRVPRTRTRTYTILLHNGGNVDVVGYPSLSGLPAGTDWETDFTAQAVSGGPTVPWHEFAPAFEYEEGIVITLPQMVLPAGSTREIEIRAAVNQPQTLQLSAAWVYLR